MNQTHTQSLKRGRRRTTVRVVLNRPWAILTLIVVFLFALLLAGELIRRVEGAEPKSAEDPYAWKSLFDGKSLGAWKVPQFGGDGEVKVAGGAIVIGEGNSMTGIVWSGKYPKIDYELELEAKRTRGNDFFCTTTFPIGESPCSLVVGGWGGTIVGLSSIDFYDASENPTTKFFSFDNDKWYRVRLRVTGAKIEAWIDGEPVVEQRVAGHRFSIRDEVDLCRPLGISTWCTEGVVRKIRLRQLRPDEVKAIAAAATD